MPKKSYQYTPRMFPRMFMNLRTGRRFGVSYTRYKSKQQMSGYVRKIRLK